MSMLVLLFIIISSVKEKETKIMLKGTTVVTTHSVEIYLNCLVQDSNSTVLELLIINDRERVAKLATDKIVEILNKKWDIKAVGNKDNNSGISYLNLTIQKQTRGNYEFFCHADTTDKKDNIEKLISSPFKVNLIEHSERGQGKNKIKIYKNLDHTMMSQVENNIVRKKRSKTKDKTINTIGQNKQLIDSEYIMKEIEKLKSTMADKKELGEVIKELENLKGNLVDKNEIITLKSSFVEMKEIHDIKAEMDILRATMVGRNELKTLKSNMAEKKDISNIKEEINSLAIASVSLDDLNNMKSNFANKKDVDYLKSTMVKKQDLDNIQSQVINTSHLNKSNKLLVKSVNSLKKELDTMKKELEILKSELDKMKFSMTDEKKEMEKLKSVMAEKKDIDDLRSAMADKKDLDTLILELAEKKDITAIKIELEHLKPTVAKKKDLEDFRQRFETFKETLVKKTDLQNINQSTIDRKELEIVQTEVKNLKESMVDKNELANLASNFVQRNELEQFASFMDDLENLTVILNITSLEDLIDMKNSLTNLEDLTSTMVHKELIDNLTKYLSEKEESYLKDVNYLKETSVLKGDLQNLITNMPDKNDLQELKTWLETLVNNSLTQYSMMNNKFTQMNTTKTPLSSRHRVEKGEITCDKNLDKRDKDGLRHKETIVTFRYPFTNPPTILMGLKSADVQGGFRLISDYTRVTRHGFVGICGTWFNGFITFAKFDWLAFD